MTQHHTQIPGFGFAAQMANADFLTFTRWYVQRSQLARPAMAHCVASLSEPEPATPQSAAPMREAA